MMIKRFPGAKAAAITTAVVVTLTLIGGSAASAAQDDSPAPAKHPPQTVEQWTVAELAVESSKDYANPFLDVEVVATFQGPHGEVITRPAFWDGGRTWRVRFAPTSIGTWTYDIASSDGRNRGLEASGTIRSVAYAGDREIYRRGFLHVGDGSNHLAYADGAPFFWLGDTHWFFDRKERWDSSNKPGMDSQFTGIVDRRVDQGFTVYQSVVFGRDAQYWQPGQQGVQIDPSYFRDQVDRKMEYIADSGLVNAFGVGFHANIDGFVEGSALLATYLVARYGAYPMVWITAGEGAGYDLTTRESRIDGWRQVARAIHEADDYDQPQTAHSTALTEKATFGLPQYYEGEGWFDFEMLQGGHGKVVPSGDYDYYAQEFSLPFLESEANYEQISNGAATDTVVRQSAYRSIQAGGFGYGYGAHGIWNATWDDQDTADDYGYGHRNWYDAIDFPGADQMTHLSEFYRSLPLASMRYRPDDAAEWDGSFVDEIDSPTVRADDARNVLTAYFQTGISSAGRLTGLPDAEYTARWFDPRTGERTLIDEALSPENGRWAVPAKPDDADWMLIVEKTHPTVADAAPAVELDDLSAGKPTTLLGGHRPQAVVVDLGAAYELSRIDLAWSKGPARSQYVLEGSLDGTTWSTLKDRSGASVFGKTRVERVSGVARQVRLTFVGSSPVDVRRVTLDVLGKIGGSATIRSSSFLVDDRAPAIDDVPAGIESQELLSQLTPTIGASLKVVQSDGVTEVTSGGVESGMNVLVTSQDAARTRLYEIRTAFDNGENFALSATASASSVESSFYSAAAVNDGNASTESWSGWAAVEFPAWVELDFGIDRTFNRVDLFTKKDYEQKGYTLQYWTGTAWADIVSVDGNTADHRAHIFEAVTASRLRVWTTQGNVRQDGNEKVARINELEVYLSEGARLVERLAVAGALGASTINVPGGTLQMVADPFPAGASDPSVVWSVTEPSGAPTTTATISTDGLLTARRNGTVLVTATALDGSAVQGSTEVVITGQDAAGVQLLSLGKPATASTSNSPASAATDGNEQTAWVATGPEFPQWLTVDLGQEFDLTSIEQVFNNEDEWKYRLESSTDGTTWSVLVDREQNTDAVTRVTHDVDATARYVRLTIVGAKVEWPNWATSRELSVFGTPRP